MATMKRAAKLDGVGNIVVEEVEVPQPGKGEVLVRLQASLISRGSEIGGRYLSETAVDASRMGYSDAGIVTELGAGVTDVHVGDRVGVSAPHAEYVIGQAPTPDRPAVVPLPDELSFEDATFLPLTTSCLAWADSAMIGPEDSVVILGQGLVGSILLQVVRQRSSGPLIAVDVLERRCQFAGRFADSVIDCSQVDPVEAVREVCSGGAAVVIDCVGGAAGVRSFAQAQEMCAAGGIIQLVGLYHREPLPLDASRIMGKLVVGGIRYEEKSRADYSQDAVAFVQAGHLATGDMITHRFPLEQAKQAFDLLVDDLGSALGVVFTYS
jgi:threonine dehydrogenase-like Zn-dependent dehydrogenase